MPKKKRTLSPQSIEKLRGLKSDPENSPKVLQFKFEPFCNLLEIRKQKAIKKQLKLEKRKLENEKKKINPVATSASGENKTYSVAPNGEQKIYRYGWTPERAQKARERININKPWLYSTGAITALGKKIVSRNAVKHGLYSKVLKNSKLESVEICVSSADLQLIEEINYTPKQENEDNTEG